MHLNQGIPLEGHGHRLRSQCRETVTENEAASRISSITTASNSTSSTRSSATIRPSIPLPSISARSGSNMNIATDDADHRRRLSRDDGQVSPTSTTATRGPLSPPSAAFGAFGSKDRRLSDLTNYRRDLSVLDSTRSQPLASLPHNSQLVEGPGAHIAPWISSGAPAGASPRAMPTSFYNGSSDSVSVASQFSPGLPSVAGRPGTGSGSGSGSICPDYGDVLYYDVDGRRPSVASIVTTASSQGSKTSANRGGFRKLQFFFGEEFPGRDSSESSLPISIPGKDQRSRSYSHGRPTQRDRNHSNATDREPSPASSRPRTPVPNPEVVPFLYQDNTSLYYCRTSHDTEKPLFETVWLDLIEDDTSQKAQVKTRPSLLHLPDLVQVRTTTCRAITKHTTTKHTTIKHIITKHIITTHTIIIGITKAAMILGL
ncbi:hypothetical protein E4U13_000018 [Claviceps humidiphila]|uniref:Uncharacterized protein n=1 Tax=Claviceps humidiphila TaxID=1294629 RepID=A0A9P7Q8H2_9HYPO|nr:hypothetical protein E4U13_000018 [Claviceps humidiphila]